MIYVNSKEIPFQKAIFSFAYNDALEPTGLGSLGVYFEVDDLAIYVGIKEDVLDVITNKNAYFVINLEEKVVKASNSLKETENSPFIHTSYINDIELQIDLAKFRAYVLRFKLNEYKDLFIKRVAKELTTYGALLRIEIPFQLGFDGEFIGYIVTEDKELLTLNKAIVDIDTLKDDVRYSIWKIKQNITPHSLKKDKVSMLFEKTRSYQKNGYNDYFLNQFNTYEKATTKKAISLTSYDKNSSLGYIDDKFYQNLEYDVFSIDSYTIAPGIVNGYNMLNFGVKEARRGYFDLSKNRAFTNIGYECKDTIFSDNFYISTSPVAFVEELSHFELLAKTKVTIPSLLMELKSIPEYNALAKRLSSFIYIDKPYTEAEALKRANQIIIEADIDESIKVELLDKVKVKFSLAYYHLTNKEKPDISVFTHPFYFESYLAHTNSTYYVADNSHSFGFKDNKYYYKGIDKEFRADKKIEFTGFSLYEDLAFDKSNIIPSKKYYNTFHRDLVVLEHNLNNVCFVYQFSSNRLNKDEYSHTNYPFGKKNIYVKVV